MSLIVVVQVQMWVRLGALFSLHVTYQQSKATAFARLQWRAIVLGDLRVSPSSCRLGGTMDQAVRRIDSTPLLGALHFLFSLTPLLQIDRVSHLEPKFHIYESQDGLTIKSLRFGRCTTV
jgi:hypothetical protein